MVWTALGTSLLFGALAMAVASRPRWSDGRLWVAFAVGGALFFAAQFVSRPVVALAAALVGPLPEDAPGWPMVAVLVLLAELFKLTTALVLHQAYRLEGSQGGAVGAAVGAGFGVWSEAVILNSVFQVARLGLPGGSSLGAALAASMGRVLANTASTGLGVHLSASGRLLAGLLTAGGVQLALDPGLRLVAARPEWGAALTLLVGGGAFAALLACGAGRSRCR
jgi:hypothetical protein